MHIIHISAELAPVAKEGGLADVVYGLARESNRQGHSAEVILPNYDVALEEEVDAFSCITKNLQTPFSGKTFQNSIWKGSVGGIPTYFLEPHHPKMLFERGCIYGCDDDVDRFLYFSRASLEFLMQQQPRPDIIHLHDWQTAIVAPLLMALAKDFGPPLPKVVFTVHNLEYQGRCAPGDIEKVGLQRDAFYSKGKMQDNIYPEALNLLSGGILYSDAVITVSPTYAQEVLTPEYGKGLESLLREQSNKFSGILNGLDYGYWNPETDKYLPAHFSSKEFSSNGKSHTTLSRKGYVKRVLKERLLLDEERRPLLATICRLVPQKGIELIKHAIRLASGLGAQFVLLGSSPIPSISDEFHWLQEEYAHHPHVRLILRHYEDLAHLIYAGSDMFLVPSRFEPCGLTQLIALRYGTIPIVRRTGGLKDTIFDVEQKNASPKKANGYTFDEFTPDAFESTLRRAIHCWYHEPEKWREFIIKGMEQDFSWEKPAKEYFNIYNELVGKEVHQQ